MKILVPVDNSEFALKALDKAIDLAKQQGAELTVMSVALEFQDVEEIPVSYAGKFKDQATRAVNKASEVVENAGLKPQTRVEIGASPADNIVKYAEEAKTDLIVMGHRGMAGLGRFLLGSVAGRVAAHAPCSVLVVR
ncbi:MAG: universal stress protein [Deltaproteobacteria bacterium]|nr:universal stress protein [Deltaproteobacteria bacterium]